MADSILDKFRGLSMVQDAPETNPADLFAKADAVYVRKSRMQLDWRKNMAFAAGQQWLGLQSEGTTAATWTTIPQASWRTTQATVNFYQSFLKIMISMLTRNQPVPYAEPPGDNPGDVEAARISTALLRYIWDHIQVQDATERVVQWGGLAGNGFFKVYWDHSAGDKTYQKPTGNMVPTGEVDEMGQPVMEEEYEEAKYGLPVVEVIPPFCVGWNDTVTLDKSPWCYHQGVYTTDEVYNLYGVEVEANANPEDIQAGGVVRYDTTVKGSTKPLGVEVLDWYERPCRKYPEGRHVVCTRKQVLLDDPWPNDAVWPLYHFGLDTVAGSPWCRTPFSDATAINAEINRMVSDVMDNTTKRTHKSWMAAKGQMQGPLNVGPGKQYTWDPQAAPGAPVPQQISVDSLEPWVLNFIDACIGYMERVIGISGVMQGQAQFSRQSGRQSAQFIEQTTNSWANCAIRLGRTLENVGVALLELWRRYGPPDTTVKIVGNDGMEAYAVATQDSFAYGCLKVRMDDVMATSRYAKMEMFERWLQYQALDPKLFMQKARELFPEIGDLDSSRLDRAWARRNIDLMKNGEQPPEPRPPMDFGVHFEETAEYMKTAEYFTLPPQSQEILRSYLDALHVFVAPPEAAGGVPGPESSSGGGIPGPTSSPPGPVGVPPEMAGSTNPPGVDLGEEATLGAMTGGI